MDGQEGASLCVRLVLSALFLLAAAGKLRYPGRFARGLREYRILPHRHVTWAVYVIPALEVLAAALLLGSFPHLIAGLAAFLLLMAFTSAMIWTLIQHNSAKCHCLGVGSDISPILVARNVPLLCCAGFVTLFANDQSSLTALPTSTGFGDLILLGLIVGASIATFVFWGKLNWLLAMSSGGYRV